MPIAKRGYLRYSNPPRDMLGLKLEETWGRIISRQVGFPDKRWRVKNVQ
jgi:hypothetical protein